jgi:[ribosomal protein S5]-alanine N-acetyltransferase
LLPLALRFFAYPFGCAQNGGCKANYMSETVHDNYFLKTARLGFRCWTVDDQPLARELWGDIEVTRFFGGPFSEAEIGERLQREIDRMSAHRFQYWPIHWLPDGEHAGCCGLRPYKPEAGIPELGFHLRPKYWGRGLAPEAATAVIEYAFRTIGVKGLSAGHHPGNVNSKKVLKKLGFSYTHDEFFPALGLNIPYYLLLPRSL